CGKAVVEHHGTEPLLMPSQCFLFISHLEHRLEYIFLHVRAGMLLPYGLREKNKPRSTGRQRPTAEAGIRSAAPRRWAAPLLPGTRWRLRTGYPGGLFPQRTDN